MTFFSQGLEYNSEEETASPSQYEFDLQALKDEYKAKHSTWTREATKWAFAIATFGLGALYLWATTLIIKEGQIGLRRNARGELLLLPPGRHSNFPWETYETSPQSLSKPVIILGPYKIITVQTGYVAKTYLRGKLELLQPGQYLLQDAAHLFDPRDGFVSIKEETKTLEPVTALTKDKIALTINTAVRYRIIYTLWALAQWDNLGKTIYDIVKVHILDIVSRLNLEEVNPVTVRNELKERSEDITNQFARMGIQLFDMRMRSWDYQTPEKKIQYRTSTARQKALLQDSRGRKKAGGALIVAESSALTNIHGHNQSIIFQTAVDDDNVLTAPVAKALSNSL